MLILLVICLVILSCNFDGKSRRLLIEIESLPMNEPDPIVETKVPELVLYPSAVATKEITIVEPSKNSKKYKRNKNRKSRSRGNR